MLNVSFYGTRGSTPCPSEENRRYGGNTSCVALESPGHDPIVLDLGTGLRFFGETQPNDGTFRGAALVTHLHWDHVQGLPFFTPVLKPGAQFDIYGPPQAAGTLSDAFHRFICPPFFPVTVEQLYGQMTFYDAGDTDLVLDGAKVRVRRRRRAHPRRPVHARGVRREGPLGPLHGRLRGVRGPRGRRQAIGALPPRSGPHGRPARRATRPGPRAGRGHRSVRSRGRLRGAHDFAVWIGCTL